MVTLLEFPLSEENIDPSHLPRNRRSTSDEDDDNDPNKKTTSGDGSGKRKHDEPDEEERKRRKLLDNMEIPSGGSKSAQHGNIFQLKLLMLLLARGIHEKYPQFRLATELDEAGKFDDVVFQYLKDKTWLLRLIQAKHKEGETPDSPLPKINEANVVSVDEKEEFSIPKYFNSYLEILQKRSENSIYSVFSKSDIEDILLVTNTGFANEKIRNYFMLDSAYDIEKDLLLKVDKETHPQWKDANVYKIKNPNNNPLVSKLKPILENNSHFYKLLEEIADSVQMDKPLEKVGYVKNYYYPLLNEVFDVKKVGANYHLEFKTNFLKGDKISEAAKKFRDALVKEATFIKSTTDIASSNEFGQTKLPSKDVVPVAQILADSAVFNKPLTAADFGENQVFIMNEVINPDTGKLLPKFFKSKDTVTKDLKEKLKSEIASRKGTSRTSITIREMETIQFNIPERFGDATLPEDPEKLKKLAKSLSKAIKDKVELTPSLNDDFKAYHAALASEVVDKNSKTFKESFIKRRTLKGSSPKPLPPATKQFRTFLLNELVAIDDASIDNLSKAEIKITKGFAEDFRPTDDVKIQDVKKFTKDFETLLSKSVNGQVEVNDKTVDKAFEADFQKLAGYVITSKFKKLRFSSAFLGSYTLPGNLPEFKKALETSLGKTKFGELYNYEFNINKVKFKTCEDGALFRSLPTLHNDNDILDFFDKFKLVVNYPNRRDLSGLVTGELQGIFKDLDNRESHSLFLETMHDWMADRMGTFLTASKAENLFKDMGQQLKFREMEGITKFYLDRYSSDYRFKMDYEYIINFLEKGKEQVLHLNTENVKLSSVKMAQVLADIKRRPELSKVKEYVYNLGLVFISLDQMSHQNSYITNDVMNCFKDPTRTNLLVMPSNNKQTGVDELATKIISVLENNEKKKLILITKKGNELASKISQHPSIKNQNKYLAKDDQNTLNSLTDESQKRLLDVEVNFQGRKVELSKITGGDENLKQLISSKVLYEIMVKDVSIGSDLRTLGDESEYYIDRVFTEEIQLEKLVLYRGLPDIFVVHDLDGTLRSNEQHLHVFDKMSEAKVTFFALHESHPEVNIHLLKMESDRLIWLRTKGSTVQQQPPVSPTLDIFQYRILTNRPTATLNANQLIQSDSDRILIISDKPGMGKSTVLIDLGLRLQEKYPGMWVMRINLLDYVDELKNAKSITNQEQAINFLLDTLSNAKDPQLRNNLEKELFKRSFENENKIALLFDAFDEISPTYKEVVVQLLQEMKKSKVKKLFVATRQNMREALERSLQTFSRTLEPFNKQNQRNFLMKYWQNKLGLYPQQIEPYVNAAINDLFIINKGKEDFTGVPLQMRMIAEFFETTIRDGLDFPESINLNQLYEGFIETKYELFATEKQGKNLANPAVREEYEILKKAYLKEHKQMALYTLFTERELVTLLSSGYQRKINKLMGRMRTSPERRGLISKIVNNKPRFIHRTIAEHFAARFFTDELLEPSKPNVQTFILTEILVHPEYKVIRAFIEQQLTSHRSDAVGSELTRLWTTDRRKLFNVHQESLIHVSAEEGNKRILTFVLESITETTRREMLAARDGNDLPPAFTAAIYDRLEILEMFRLVYGYREVDITELRSYLFLELQGPYTERVEEARKKLQRIANLCIPKLTWPGSRRRRAAEKCAFSWSDVDQIAVEPIRDVEDLRIDSEKFLEFTRKSKNDRKNKQLLELVENVKNVDAGRITGRKKYLLDQVISDEGIKNYVQKERINELAGNTIKDPESKMSHVLKNRLMNAAGKVQMTMTAYGVYSTVQTCKRGISTDCALSLSGIGFSVLSQPIESALIKVTPRLVSQAGQVGSKLFPKILGHDTKFLLQFVGVKYGAKIIKGVGGVLGGIFDIIDAARSTEALIECDKKKNTKNPCSAKEIRDNIAGISFATISFITGVALLLAGETFGLSLAVAVVIMAANMIYNGISNVIEYKEKYATTGWENFRLFWHTVALQPPPSDVMHLAGRTDFVNDITQQAADQLRNMTENFIGYSFGLGKVVIRDDSPVLERASSFIDLVKPNTKRYSLSRVQPKHINDFRTLCLPRKTNSDYEFNSESFDSYRSEYYCENGVTLLMEDRLKKAVKNPAIFYDFAYINGGYVAGNSSVHNIFYLREGKTVVKGGRDTVNSFVVTEGNFTGAIQMEWNSTNVIDVSQLADHGISLSWRNQQPMYMYLDLKMASIGTLGAKVVNIEKYQRESSLSYRGSQKTLDKIFCTMEDVYMDHNLLVDGGGGLNETNPDLLMGCTDAVIWPNTEVYSKKGNYSYYIRSEGYEAKTASAIIDVIGEGKIVFPELFLLKDCKEISYSSSNNTLSFTLPLDQDGKFTLHLKNYLNKEKTPNFLLVDKMGSYIVPKIFDKSVIDMFEMYAVDSDTSQLSAAVERYDKLLVEILEAKNYKVFGLIKFITDERIKKAVFGSNQGDIFVLDNDTIYARGNSGSDVYLVNEASSWDRFEIDNYAKDLKLDVLGIFFKAEISLSKVNGKDLRLKVKDVTKGKDKVVDILRYFDMVEYRHLMVLDNESNGFIPFESEGDLQLLPFYHPSDKMNVFIVSNSTRAVIDCAVENMSFYKRDGSLLISSNKLSDIYSPLSVILKLYYSENDRWKDLELYSYNRGNYRKIDLNKIQLTGVNADDVYSQVVDEYVIDFNKPSTEIAHNQHAKSSMYGEREKIGVLIFTNGIKPEHLTVLKSNDDVIFRDEAYSDQVVIKNWYKDQKYAMSMIEFDMDLEPIRLFVFNKDVDLVQKLKDAEELIGVLKLMGDDPHKILKCNLAINSLHVKNSFIVLGFTTLQQAVTFIKNCNFAEFRLSHLRGIKIFLPVYYIQAYTLQLKLRELDPNDRQYRDVLDHFSNVMIAVGARIKIDMILEDATRDIDEQTKTAVEYFLLTSCSTYVGDAALSETMRLQLPKKFFFEPMVFVKTMLLFIAKSHNDFLFKYPQVEKNTTLEIDFDNLRLLDITVVDYPKNNPLSKEKYDKWKALIEDKIDKISEALSADKFKGLYQGWDKNLKENILKLVEINEEDLPFKTIKVKYEKKNKTETSENADREKREATFNEFIDDDEEFFPPIKSGASSQYGSFINDIFKWINPITWFSGSIGSVTEATRGQLELTTNIQHKRFELNSRDFIYSHTTDIPPNDASANTFEFPSYNLNSTLLLMDVFTRKYTGEKYIKNSGCYGYQDQKEEANILAYSYYCQDM